MNTVVILIDSLNRHMLPVYNPSSPVAAPNFSRFAERAWRFDNHFVGSLPCMPARREIMTGRREMMWRPWGPLEPFDQRLPSLLAAGGHRTALLTDHYHYWEETANGYIQSFESAELVRGHENDFWKPPVPPHTAVPGWVERIEHYRPGKGRGYYGNVEDFGGEEDYFPAKLFSRAAGWLERYAREQSFYLQVESFDVHEPFDVPEPYRSMYTDGSQRDRFNVWPPYQDPVKLAQFMAQTSDAELAFIRAQYAGKLTMVDRWFGKLLDTFDRLELWSDTMLIVTTDHGHDLGQRGAFGKQWPHYDSHANIPLLVWHPDHPGHGQSKQMLSSTVDLFATVLDVMGTPIPLPVHSQSLLPVIAGEHSSHRDAVVYGTFGLGVGCTDGEWTILKSPAQRGPLYSYSCSLFKSATANNVVLPVNHGFYIPGVRLPQWKIPVTDIQQGVSNENLLFNRRLDPDQTENLWHEAPEALESMTELLRSVIEREGAPGEQYQRLGLEG